MRFIHSLVARAKIRAKPRTNRMPFFHVQNVVIDKEFSGIIKRLDTERGFGFINYTSFKDNSNQDIFFHSSSIEMGLTLIEGDEVVFDIVAGKKGPMASAVALKKRGSKEQPTLKVTMEKKVSGSVKWFDTERGFGFIKRDNNNQDVFVHKSSIEMGLPLTEGDEVVFDIVASSKGPKAKAVALKKRSSKKEKALKAKIKKQ